LKPKSDRKFAEQLASKKYLSYLLEDCSREKNALESYLRHHKNYPSRRSEQLLALPGYQELLSPFFKTENDELQKWMYGNYKQNPYYPEKKIHPTPSGHMVRSKSEAMIAHLLYTNHIPFRYECELILEDNVFYPDFTIKHPDTGEICYWEHFGKMDDPDYIRKTIYKLKVYITNNILPSIHLIITSETLERPLDLIEITSTIQHYFGSKT